MASAKNYETWMQVLESRIRRLDTEAEAWQDRNLLPRGYIALYHLKCTPSEKT